MKSINRTVSALCESFLGERNMFIFAVFYTSLLVSHHLGYVLSYQLILRMEDNVTDPQTNCYNTMKGKIAKEDDIAKNEELIARCVPEYIRFWIGPMSRVNRSEYLTGKMCLFTKTNETNHHAVCIDNERYFPTSAYLCKTGEWSETNGGINCLKYTDSVVSTLQISSESKTIAPYGISESKLSEIETITPNGTSISKLSMTNSSAKSSEAGSDIMTTETPAIRNTHVIYGDVLNKRNNLEIKKEKVSKVVRSFIDKHKVQVGIVLGTLLFAIVVISSVVLLFKLKRRHTKLRRDSSASDRNRLQLESQYLKKTCRGDIRSLASCALSNDIEIFAIDDDVHGYDEDDMRYMYNHLQRSVSDPVVNVV